MDTTAALQIMVSQPLVAAWLAGFILGDPGAGLAAGIVLQALWSREFALGGAAFPQAGPGGVVGGALAALAPGPAVSLGALHVPPAPGLAAALVTAILVGEAGRRILVRLRSRRSRWIADARSAAEAGHEAAIRRASLRGIPETALLGLGLVLGGTAIGLGLLGAARTLPPAQGSWVLFAALGTGVGLSLRKEERGRWIWLGGALAAALVRRVT